MKIFLPANIYSALFGLYLPDNLKNEVEILPSSLIGGKLMENEDAVGLLPSLDLIKLTDLKISKNIAISFDGALSQSYLYFIPDQNKFDKLLIRGDVSTNEIILSKILFRERFDLITEIILDTGKLDFNENNYLIAGQDNNELVVKHNGVSLADQLAEFLDFPYVNFVLASQDQSIIENMNESLKNLDSEIEENIISLLDKIQLPYELNKYLSEHIDTVYYEMTENEVEGLHELLKLPFFHGIVDDMVELKMI